MFCPVNKRTSLKRIQRFREDAERGKSGRRRGRGRKGLYSVLLGGGGEGGSTWRRTVNIRFMHYLSGECLVSRVTGKARPRACAYIRPPLSPAPPQTRAQGRFFMSTLSFVYGMPVG